MADARSTPMRGRC